MSRPTDGFPDQGQRMPFRPPGVPGPRRFCAGWGGHRITRSPDHPIRTAPTPLGMDPTSSPVIPGPYPLSTHPGHGTFIENKGQAPIQPNGHRPVEVSFCRCFGPQSRCSLFACCSWGLTNYQVLNTRYCSWLHLLGGIFQQRAQNPTGPALGPVPIQIFRIGCFFS